ncbi:MAG: cobyric acid synthase CobQ, partial [Bacteroidota bacterium]
MSKVKHYPVDNGDQTLISVEENGYTTNMLVDCRIRENSMDEADKSKYDVKSDLLKSLNKRTISGVVDAHYVDIFTLTHGDDDHLHGFEKNFFQGSPSGFTKKHRDDGRIFIDVLWFSPMVMGESTNDDEDCFNREAKRRIKLHRDKSPDKDLPGNRIVIIGYDASENLDGLELVRYIPGKVVTRFNNRNLQTFSIFIHAPFKEQLISADPCKNHTSIVFQVRFKDYAWSTEFSALFMFGGDADHPAWKMIMVKTKKSGRHISERALDFDIFLAPHHCSWTFFNNTPQAENPQPVATSLEVLGFARKGARVIASSKVILNNDDNPPHYKAKQEYIKKLENSSKFLNTATEPKEDAPEPIVFVITSNGPSI